MLCCNLLVEEKAGTFTELGGRFGGEILAGTSLSEPLCHLWMTVKIVFKAGSDVLALRNEGDRDPLRLSLFREREAVRGVGREMRFMCSVDGGDGEVFEVLLDFREKERIVCTAEDDGVDERVLG